MATDAGERQRGRAHMISEASWDRTVITAIHDNKPPAADTPLLHTSATQSIHSPFEKPPSPHLSLAKRGRGEPARETKPIRGPSESLRPDAVRLLVIAGRLLSPHSSRQPCLIQRPRRAAVARSVPCGGIIAVGWACDCGYNGGRSASFGDRSCHVSKGSPSLP